MSEFVININFGWTILNQRKYTEYEAAGLNHYFIYHPKLFKANLKCVKSVEDLAVLITYPVPIVHLRELVRSAVSVENIRLSLVRVEAGA